MSSVDEALELVINEAERSIAGIEKSVANDLARSLPAQQPTVADEDLAVACEMSQGGRDSGSSRLRGSAQALTGVRHYFWAPFITEHEIAVWAQREALDAGIALLRAVNAAPRLEACSTGSTPRGTDTARGRSGSSRVSTACATRRIRRTTHRSSPPRTRSTTATASPQLCAPRARVLEHVQRLRTQHPLELRQR